MALAHVWISWWIKWHWHICGFRCGLNGTGTCVDFVVDKMVLAHVWISWWIKWYWHMCGFRGGLNGTDTCVDFVVD